MTTPAPPVTDREGFERQLLELRRREKAHTREGDRLAAERPCYLRRGNETFLTYWTTGRGDEILSPSFGLLDMTAYGRREKWEDSPDGWPQRPTHSVLRTDEDGTLIGPGNRGRPAPQWTRLGQRVTER